MSEFNRPYGLSHTTNLAWRDTELENDPENSWAYKICNLLYGRAGGYAKVGLYGKHSFYYTDVLRDPNKFAAIIGSRRYNRSNTVVSVCTYRTDNDGAQRNLLTINAVCIDIDFKASNDPSIATMEATDAVSKFYGHFILSEIIPHPTYVEYGRNFRLVYVLKSPFIVPKKEKVRKNILSLFKRIITVISETIQSHADWGVDKKYNVAPYVRIPGSQNVKWENFDPANPCPSSVDEVRIAEYCSSMYLWDIQELIEIVLPEKPEWYDEWKQKQKKKGKTKSKVRTKSLSELCRKRMDDLATLQKLGWDEGHREFMVFLYRLSAVQSGMSPDEALEAAQQFNSHFKKPLHPHTVSVQCKPPHNGYKYKNVTIRNELGLGKNDYPHLFEGDGKSRHDRYEETKQKQIAAGTLIPKQQRLEQTYTQIISMQKAGASRKEIEKTLNIPTSTMTRHLKEIRKRSEQ